MKIHCLGSHIVTAVGIACLLSSKSAMLRVHCKMHSHWSMGYTVEQDLALSLHAWVVTCHSSLLNSLHADIVSVLVPAVLSWGRTMVRDVA